MNVGECKVDGGKVSHHASHCALSEPGRHRHRPAPVMRDFGLKVEMLDTCFQALLLSYDIDHVIRATADELFAARQNVLSNDA